MSNITRTWWAANTSTARRTAVGTVALGLGLSAISYFVWVSPSNPVATTIAAVNQEQVRAEALTTERADLLDMVVSLKSDLESSTTASDDLEAQLALIEKQLTDTKAALAAAEGEVTTLTTALNKKSATSKKTPAKVVTASTGAITAPSKSELMAPASQLFGMYTAQAPFNWATFDDTATKVGAAPEVVGYFGGWDEPFRANAVTRSWARDTMPMLTWESRPIGAGNDQVNDPNFTLPTILGDPATGTPGAYDAYLHQYAKDIVATGLPLAIRFDHEMNGIWYPWAETDGAGNPINGNNPGDYVKVWQYVHDIFEAEGANELVIWVWSPNIVNNLPTSHKTLAYTQSLYPGDDYVDWVGVSAYLRPPYKADNTFTFDYTFGQTLEQLRAITDKPIFLAEIGASETGGHKAAWVSSLFEALQKPENDDIIGFSWFNLAVTSYVEGERATNDWRIDSRADSLAAFVAGMTAQ